MSQLLTLFKDSETRLGVFYPKDYVVATFWSFDKAKAAFQSLRHAGVKEYEAMAAPGSDVLDYFNELRAETGIWGNLMTELSRLIGTEAKFLDEDAKAARRGAGFLVVHCTNEADAERIRKLLTPHDPLAMQWYRAGAIRCLV